MLRRRAPWVAVAAGGPFLGYFLLLVYCDVRRHEAPGMLVDFVRDAMIVRAVVPDSAADRAGLRPGDRIVGWSGRPILDRDWMLIGANLELERPMPLEVERGSGRLTASLTLLRERRPFWRSQSGLMLAAVRTVQLVTLGFAFLIAYRRPLDPIARMGAWLLATVGVFCIVLPDRIAAVWRDLPPLAGALLWPAYVSSFAICAIVAMFVAMFSRRTPSSWLAWIASCAPMAVALVGPTSYMLRAVYRPETVRADSFGGTLLVLTSIAYLAWGLTMLVVNYRHLEDITERRRVRVIVFGLLVGCVLGAPVIPLHWLAPVDDLGRPLFSSPLSTVGTLFMLAIPLSFAYAILRHRLFDVSVIIRQGVRYALARHVVLWLVPGLALALLADLALMHRQDPLVAVFQAHLWIYVGLAALAIVGHYRRQHWLDAIDRRFFRERYDARRLLRRVAEDLRQAGSLERVAPLLVGQLESSLHSTFAALLVRRAGESEYHVIACAPAGHAPPPLDARTRLVTLLGVLGRPLEVALPEAEWLASRLPPPETAFLRDAHIDLLVPVAETPDRTSAVLALGPKRSEEPYTADDQDLLMAITDSLAWLLERPSFAAPASAAFEECPECGTCCETGTGTCPRDGARLAPIAAPPVLAARYRLQQRLGRGGMGTVYAALDTALERRVAVKLIREDLFGDAEAAARFEREARAAAGLAHPNVVTVHDFGVSAGNRAYLVMEYLDGATLREALRHDRALAPSRALQLLRGVCAAIEAAHRRQLVHRDLKPENIFLVQPDGTEVAKVLDFGIAKFLPVAAYEIGPKGTGAGVLLGTLPYMAPEQLRGEEVRPAWDLWALAVIAFEMLTGAHPFAASGDAANGIGSILGGRLAASAPLVDAPPRCRDFFFRALALDPAARPDSPARFFADLEYVLA